MSTFARRRLVQSGVSISERGGGSTENVSRLCSRQATQKAAEGGTLRDIYFGECPQGTHEDSITGASCECKVASKLQ
jgi:hypothetical protein